MEIFKKDIEALQQYRKEHFSVQIHEEDDSFALFGKTLILGISTNGYQWTNIGFDTQEEIDKVIKVLQNCNTFK